MKKKKTKPRCWFFIENLAVSRENYTYLSSEFHSDVAIHLYYLFLLFISQWAVEDENEKRFEQIRRNLTIIPMEKKSLLNCQFVLENVFQSEFKLCAYQVSSWGYSAYGHLVIIIQTLPSQPKNMNGHWIKLNFACLERAL